MKLFKHRIEMKISRLDAKDRILWLANRLMDEIEASGRETNANCNSMRFVNINHYSHGAFAVENSIARNGGWSISGKRAYKAYLEEPE